MIGHWEGAISVISPLYCAPTVHAALRQPLSPCAGRNPLTGHHRCRWLPSGCLEPDFLLCFFFVDRTQRHATNRPDRDGHRCRRCPPGGYRFRRLEHHLTLCLPDCGGARPTAYGAHLRSRLWRLQEHFPRRKLAATRFDDRIWISSSWGLGAAQIDEWWLHCGASLAGAIVTGARQCFESWGWMALVFRSRERPHAPLFKMKIANSLIANSFYHFFHNFPLLFSFTLPVFTKFVCVLLDDNWNTADFLSGMVW